jgi:PAS domain S-box-containing protein
MAPPVDFEALFELSPNPYMLLDRQLKYVAANRAYLSVTGRRLEELLGRDIFEVFPNDPADPDNQSATQLRQSFERVLGTGETDVIAFIRYRLPASSGAGGDVEDRVWSATHVPIRGGDGRVAHILQHTVDVTELQNLRLAARQATPAGDLEQMGAGVLRRAREVQETNLSLVDERTRLQQLFQQAPGFMAYLRGPDHVIEIANDGYRQLVGPREILGKTVREALPELKDQEYFNILERVFRTGEPFVGDNMRVLLQHEPGAAPAEVFLNFVYQPILGDRSRTLGILVLGHDITQQRQQESERDALLVREQQARSAAEAAEERQRFLAESIPQQVWTARPDGQLDFVNGRVVEYFGMPAEEVIGDAWQSVVHPEDLEPFRERWREAIRTGDEFEFQFRLRRADGTYRWHLSRALALRAADGRIAKWFGTNTDMDELTRARDELSKRAKFDQQLLGIVSHDLRNPLNAIGMATALLLKRGQLDEQHVRIVTRFMSSSDRAVRLIRDFLDFTQARVMGEIPVSPAPANIREIARQVFDEVLLSQHARHGVIEHQGEEQGMWDPDRITQVIGNLLSNAFQHSPEWSTVRLSTCGDDDCFTIDVHNEGTPIPPEDLARLFEPFERGTGASATGRSIGLGLYISRQIISAHGGKISVTSTVEKGTCFTVWLPRTSSSRCTPSERTLGEVMVGNQ